METWLALEDSTNKQTEPGECGVVGTKKIFFWEDLMVNG